MNIRQTSIDTFNQIKEEGLLSNMRLKMLEAILNNAPCTASEAFKVLGCKTNQSGRITELKELGVIYEVQTRICNVTGRSAIEWDLTDRLPENVNLKNNKKNRVNNAINALRELYKNKKTSTDDDWRNVADLIKII
jgi:chromosome segregation and condensation protein ScpB